MYFFSISWNKNTFLFWNIMYNLFLRLFVIYKCIGCFGDNIAIQK